MGAEVGKHVRLTGELMRSGTGAAIVDAQGVVWRFDLTAELEQLIGCQVLVDGFASGERIRADYVGPAPGNEPEK